MNSRKDKMILAKTRSEVAKGWGEGSWLQRGLKWKYHILCLDFGGDYTICIYTYACQNSSNCTLKIENFLNYTPDFIYKAFSSRNSLFVLIKCKYQGIFLAWTDFKTRLYTAVQLNMNVSNEEVRMGGGDRRTFLKCELCVLPKCCK